MTRDPVPNPTHDRQQRLAAFRAAIDGIACSDAPALLDAKSGDYHWYSPILKEQLQGKRAELVVRPVTEDEVLRVAAACARQRLPLTVRGGGTGNYGQCVPLEGGIVLDITGLNRVLDVQPGSVLCEAGILILDLENAVHAHPCVPGGQELLMYPSTRDIATIGGFIAGGYGGTGTVRNGILKDPGNVSLIRVVTLEEQPRVIELHGADIQKVHHAFGTNGIITRLRLALKPAVDWVHGIALFPDYATALRFGCAATERIGDGIDAFLITAVDRRFAPYYRGEFGDRFPDDADAVFSMVNPATLEAWRALVAQFGGRETMALTEPQLKAQGLSPAFECAWNHTTLMALRQDSSWTNLQTVYPWVPGQGIDIDLVIRQMERYGDEVVMHHEFGRSAEGCVSFALPLVSWFDRERLYEIIAEHEADGCLVFDNHVVTIEDGGMKTIDTAQIDFKRIADPHGLMNPGKTRGWTADMARP